jgi:hypothetical protein
MLVAQGMRHFGQGISHISQWTGQESKEIEKQLLPIVAGHRGINSDVTALARSILEFTYRARSLRMTEDQVNELDNALADLHQFKSVVIRQKLFKRKKGEKKEDVYTPAHFDNIQKLHMLSHYSASIREMGTPDGYNSEAPEHLHIQYAKRGWRSSNKVRPLPQMVKFIQRYEALRIQRAYLDAHHGLPNTGKTRKWASRVVYGEEEEGLESGGGGLNRDAVGDEGDGDGESEGEESDEDEERVHYECGAKTASEAKTHVIYPTPMLSLALRPTAGRVKVADINNRYGAVDLIRALNRYLKASFPHASETFPTAAHHEFNVWHRLYLQHKPLPFDPESSQRDVIRAHPPSSKAGGGQGDGCFDVALFIDQSDRTGIHRKYLNFSFFHFNTDSRTPEL